MEINNNNIPVNFIKVSGYMYNKLKFKDIYVILSETEKI